MPETNLQLWTNYTDITEPLREQAIWEVEYVGKKFFLTTEERNFFEEQLKNNVKYVRIKEQTLTGGFISISLNKTLKKHEQEKIREKEREQEMFWANLQYDCYPIWDLYTRNMLDKKAVATLFNGGTIRDKKGKEYNLEYFRNLQKGK